MDDVALAPALLSEANARVRTWLGRFETALSSRDIDGAVACFAETCFWRDLINLAPTRAS